MILLLLLLVAAQVTLVQTEQCPDDSACLYYVNCFDSNRPTSVNVSREWDKELTSKATSECFFHFLTELHIRPLSKHKWNFTLKYTRKDIIINFGNSLTILANETAALFKNDSKTSTKIPLKLIDAGNTFILESPKKNLLKFFEKLPITYILSTEDVTNVSNQSLFWDKVHANTPCDSSLILDDCTAEVNNCTKLHKKLDVIECETNITLWLKSDNSAWQQLTSISCDDEKEWKLNNDTITVATPSDKMEFRCANEEPEPWTASLTGRTPNVHVVASKKKEEGDEPFNLIDSPFTWVGIGLAGIIALAAVALAIGYAYRKLWKNPPADKGGMSKVSFHQVPQQDPSKTGSGSNSEIEKSKTDQSSMKQLPPPPSKTPAAEVSRADGPSHADTVKRLSMIQTIRDSSNVAPIPAPN